MTKTVMQMVEEAQAVVPGISPEEARRRSQDDPNTLIVDVRDAANRRASGMVEGAITVSSGTLPLWLTRKSRKSGVTPDSRIARVP